MKLARRESFPITKIPRDVIASHFPRRCPWDSVGLAGLGSIAVLDVKLYVWSCNYPGFLNQSEH